MADAAIETSVKNEDKPVQVAGGFWSRFEALRSEIDRLFDGLMPSSWRSPDRSLLGCTLPSQNGWVTAARPLLSWSVKS